MRTNVHPFSDVCLMRPGEDLLATLREGVNAIGGISKYVKSGDTVFIKPNLTAGMPASTGGTTDVRFAEAEPVVDAITPVPHHREPDQLRLY